MEFDRRAAVRRGACFRSVTKRVVRAGLVFGSECSLLGFAGVTFSHMVAEVKGR